ncbi:MAG: hypothetical protein KF810_00005, partial [Rhizobiaceae bacterium]|nr:hypothetical protein [Rhizobiaceae bacterium]
MVGTLGDAFTDHEFTPQAAKQDKIDIDWDGLRLYGNDLDGLGLLNALARYRGEEEASTRFRELPDGRGAFFNVPQTRGATSSVRFRSKSNVKYRTPAGLSLIAGRLSIHRRVNDRGQTAFTVGGNLSFNPTRFFRHSFMRDLVGYDVPVERLLTAPLARNNGVEYILDDNDNCIIETSKLRHARHATYAAHRDAYIVSSFNFLRERMRGALLLPGTSPLFGTETFNLKRVETYWERACQSPLEYMRAVADRLMSYKSGVRVAAHMPPSSYRRDGNALSVELPLRDG